ncbi:hypothetical protein Nepgr_025490 [Nepenthes gracilis]|uniref:F-box domain-containing protein n=1 Tax=Nepenthes gracilis TaxID=150966 RepID=A0AAD3T6K6_NEPGR|nr:hypothetical protein Nepgr_025490 [Nepenthes gracilis]
MAEREERGGEMAEREESRLGNLEHLPAAMLATILTKLDPSSICSVASTCRTLRASASQIFAFLPSFHLLDFAPTFQLLVPLLPPNPYLKSLKIDCCRLDDSAIGLLLQPSLHELYLHNAGNFSGAVLSEIGKRCHDLRSLYLGSVAEKRGRAIHISHLEELLKGCSELETLNLMFDASTFLRVCFARAWTLASEKLTSLEIGYIPAVNVTALLSPTAGPRQPQNQIQLSIWPNIQRLCLSVDYITDSMISTISSTLTSLIHLDLRDAPMIEPRVSFDLTNSGLQQINQHGKLKHLSLVRSQELLVSYFHRVNDLGILLMADRCSSMESICLGGFCRVTDTGIRAIMHSCSNLYRLKVTHGTKLTDLLFLDISATSLSLTHVTLRWCNLLTSLAIAHLASNMDLTFLDLRDCRSLGDEALAAIGTLPKLKILLLDGCDISDAGISCLRNAVSSTLVSLSVRGCRRLTDQCIVALFGNSSKVALRELDLSNLPNISDNGVLLLAQSRVPIQELRMRQCAQISDTSVMALASMQVDDSRWHGNGLQLLDLYNCCRLTALAFRWLKKPYFPRLKWLGVTGCVNRDLVDALARSRPYLHISCRGDELGNTQWDHSDNFYVLDDEEMDELEQWILNGEEESDDNDADVEMEVAEDSNDSDG